MPRRATRPGPPTLLLGVWGQGESSPENITALLDDYIDGAGNVTPKFVFPLSTEESSDAVLATFDYAVSKEYETWVVYAKKPASKALKEVLVKATKEIVADAPITDDDRFESTEDAIGDYFAVTLGEKPDDARLLFLWADDDKGEPDEQDQRVLAAVADCGVVALDLAQGLEVLDVSPPEDEGGDGADDAGGDAAEPEAGGDDEPDFDTVQAWPIRRIRSYAKKVAQQDREDDVEGVPSDDELDDSEKYNKDALMEYLFPSDDKPEPEPEPVKKSGRAPRKPADDGDGKGITPARATEMREDSEAEGTDSTTKNRRKAAAAKAEPPADEPEPAAEGEDTGETAIDRFREALGAWAQALSDGDDDSADEAFVDVADSLADVIIDRIAARVEKEPGESDLRQEIAPKRPPGKPRKDGATPTRRRSAQSTSARRRN